MNRRMIEIIEYLIKNKGIAHIKNMAEVLVVNERTIRYDVENINELLIKNGFTPIKKLGKGELEKSNYDQLKDFLMGLHNFESSLLSEYKAILILIKIAFEEEININQLCETFDLSRTTIKTALKEVKNIMGVYNLQLIANPLKGLKISGNEENLRRLQLKLLNQYTSLKGDILFQQKFIQKNIFKYFSEINPNSIKIFINYIMRSLERVISDEAYSTISNYILIMIERIKKGNLLQNQSNEKFFSETDEFESATRFIVKSYDMQKVA
ncbi:MAG: BglG family transcription antiterminator [Fusobacteriaceae bacterium]